MVYWAGWTRAVCCLALLCLVQADVYLHIPRGSNNRLNEQSANRANANRMFDSQNNNRGGYNVGDREDDAANNNANKQYQMEYFMSDDSGGKTYLNIEWTNQHGCGGNEDNDPHKQNCNLVMQFRCQEDDKAANDDDLIRPGTNTATQNYQGPQADNEQFAQKENRKNGAVQANRGLDEPWEWYDKCYTRERNQGLFTADQILKNNNGQGVSAATYTRQNPNGNRYGYECPEERDYYPYWHPSPWIDIAVLTDNTSLCSYYEENSFNSKPLGECVETYNNGRKKHASDHNNPEDCEDAGHDWVEFYNFLEKDPGATTQAQCEGKNGGSELQYKWAVPFDVYDEETSITEECLVLPPPLDCAQAPWSRSNHLGNGRGASANTYAWQIPYFPSDEQQRCSFRLRYNISTDDYSPWATDSSSNKDLQNGVVSPVQQNPYVNIGADNTALRLAINTAQFGRTFQDRSHPFILKSRPPAAASAIIHNLNVRGKRGNIVQVYPAVEYDFAPTRLEMEEGDLVHFQWTGSNTHNNNNPGGDGQTGDAGEGTGGTDRSNVVQLGNLTDNFPLPFSQTTLWDKSEIVYVPFQLQAGQSLSKEDLAINMASSGYFRCKDAATCGAESLQQKAALNNLLNNAPASYEAPLLRIEPGEYNYTCTRNNNFSNRSQKGTIVVKPSNQ